MGIGRVFSHTHTAILQHKVDIAEVIVHLLVSLFLQSKVMLQTQIRLHQFRDITASTKDSFHLTLLITQRHELQLIIHLAMVDILIKHARVGIDFIQSGHVYRLHRLQRNILANDITQMDMVLQSALQTTWEGFCGFLVHIRHITQSIIGDGIDHGRAENRLIA